MSADWDPKEWNKSDGHTWSNISKSLALGWWIVQMIVLPPSAKDLSSETHWKHDALSRPLNAQHNTTQNTAVNHSQKVNSELLIWNKCVHLHSE